MKLLESTVAQMPPHLRGLFVQLPNPVIAMFPESKGQQGDVRGTEKSHTGDDNTHCYGEFGRIPSPKRGDNGGSAARFFNSFPMTDADYADTPIFYQAKATKADRAGSRHPTVKPVALMQWLCRLVTPPGGTVLDPFAGSGTTAEAARREGFDCLLMEAEDQFVADIRARFNLTTDDDDDFDSLSACSVGFQSPAFSLCSTIDDFDGLLA